MTLSFAGAVAEFRAYQRAVAELRACHKTTPEIAEALGVPIADVEAVLRAYAPSTFTRLGDVLNSMAAPSPAAPAFRRALQAAADAGPITSVKDIAEKHIDAMAQAHVEGR